MFEYPREASDRHQVQSFYIIYHSAELPHTLDIFPFCDVSVLSLTDGQDIQGDARMLQATDGD